jgi:hypothetical protein
MGAVGMVLSGWSGLLLQPGRSDQPREGLVGDLPVALRIMITLWSVTPTTRRGVCGHESCGLSFSAFRPGGTSRSCHPV